MGVPDNWVDAVGWRHEEVHTGILRAVLEHPAGGPALAQALTNLAVTGVRDPVCEQSDHGTRADLRCRLVIDGHERPLAVETKVDSRGDRSQLQRTQPNPDGLGVLLAVGRAGLRLRRYDCDRVTRETGVPWHFWDIETWSEQLGGALAKLTGLPRYVQDYALRAREEAGRFAAARARIRNGDSEDDPALDPCLWLSELRDLVDDVGCRWEANWVNGEILHSGGSDRWRAKDGLDLYLQVHAWAGGIRRLTLRGGSAPDARPLRKLREDASITAAVEGAGFERALRPIGDRTRSCVIATLDLTGWSPDCAASAVHRLEEALDPVARKAVHEASVRS